MARGGFSRRRGGGIPLNVIGILAGVGLVIIVGALFWFSSQAESRKPAQTEITVEATNVGPH
jgi:ABC-type transporter Mla subunit MlaD